MGSSESLPVLSLTSLLPSVLGTSSGDSVLCYKTNPSLNPVLLSLTPTFPFTLPSHQPLFLGSWHCPAPAHCCLWVCGCVLLNSCSRACRRCLWEVFVKFTWMQVWSLGEHCFESSWETGVRMVMSRSYSVPLSGVPSSNVQWFWTLALLGIRKKIPLELGSREQWLFYLPVIFFLGLSGNAI